MATYRFNVVDGTEYLNVEERPLYGSSRLGTFDRREYMRDILTPAPVADVIQPMNLKYELTDHLGNVCAVVSGRLLDGGNSGSAKQAELISANGYEPFGSLLPGRNFSSNTYAHGFNGMRKDDEVHGATGTSYDFGARLYDPRVGRWLSLDPLAAKVPDASPYAFAINSPILMYDEGGNIFRIYYEVQNKATGKTTLTYVDFNGTTAIAENGQAYTSGTNQFVEDVITSYRYITENEADIDGALKFVAEASQITKVDLTRTLGTTLYDGDGTINFNPLEGLYTMDGFQSPAVGFFHEAYHRYLELKGRKFQTTQAEEDYVLQHAETPAVEKLREKGFTKEGTSPYGTDYIEKFAKGPTSTEKADSPKEARESLKTRNVTTIEF